MFASLGNARSMRVGKDEIQHIRMFRLNSGGPPQMEENDSVMKYVHVGMWEDCLILKCFGSI